MTDPDAILTTSHTLVYRDNSGASINIQYNFWSQELL